MWKRTKRNLIKMLCPERKMSGSSVDVGIGGNLTQVQQSDVRKVLCEFADVLTENPSHTKLVEHEIYEIY